MDSLARTHTPPPLSNEDLCSDRILEDLINQVLN